MKVHRRSLHRILLYVLPFSVKLTIQHNPINLSDVTSEFISIIVLGSNIMHAVWQYCVLWVNIVCEILVISVKFWSTCLLPNKRTVQRWRWEFSIFSILLCEIITWSTQSMQYITSKYFASYWVASSGGCG